VQPSFAKDPVQLLVIHCDAEGQTPARHTQWYGLTFPIALDFDSELFRRYRLPGHVFPLNVVIDKEGKIAHIGDDLDKAVAAARAALN